MSSGRPWSSSRLDISTASPATLCPWMSGRSVRSRIPRIALDVYAWLAQRLHRMPTGRPQMISWESLHDQFGHGFAGRPGFPRNLREGAGVRWLRSTRRPGYEARPSAWSAHSPPPVASRLARSLSAWDERELSTCLWSRFPRALVAPCHVLPRVTKSHVLLVAHTYS